MISTKRQTQFKRSAFIFLVALISLSLSACGGGKKIVTSDDSADYKSARSLPPLKKPSRVVVSQKNSDTRPAADSGIVDESSAKVVEKTDALASSPVINVAKIPVEQLSATVVDVGSGQARLEVAADFDRAWDYLNVSLQQSDLTVFSRNKEAGRFSIGCANIAAAPTVVKSGRWSFFNRDKQQSLEYCALRAVEKRGITVVSVLNQAGEEVSGEYSKKVFSRILNN
ncbi:MAG: outer membrane protein assembly factor BamC [Arenicella sp.]|nr:outer membrane protein assembly factor BamC [Arenicella sp.]